MGPTDAPESRSSRKLPLVLIVAVIAASAGYAFFSLYQSPTTRECAARYQAAKTPADSALVDQFIPGTAAGRSREAHSCGFIRRTARWADRHTE